jgi:phospholipase/lecithinase/hemolysin
MIRSFGNIQIFGDSLSDVGRYHAYTRGLVFPDTVYWKGRSSNGPVWVDYVLGALGVPGDNYAFAGAPTRPPKFPYHIIFPSLQEQLEEHQARQEAPPPPESLAILWIGGNNYIYSGKRMDVVSYTIGDIRTSATEILARGVQALIIANLPDLSSINFLPSGFKKEEYQERLKNFTEEHNRKLLEVIDDLGRQHPRQKIKLFDAYGMDQYLRIHSHQLGFHDLTQPCYRGRYFAVIPSQEDICPNPQVYKNWDDVHPTTRVHCYFAVQFLDTLAQAGLGEGFSKEEAMRACTELQVGG